MCSHHRNICAPIITISTGSTFLVLNGCGNPNCSGHIFLPDDDAEVCPNCNEASRYGPDRSPIEVVHYFPLKPKLRALLKIPRFRSLLNYENTRDRNPDIMSDVYDSPAWRRKMGVPKNPIDRIGLLACGDGIPPFRNGQISLTLYEFVIVSLPPEERYKMKNLLIHMLTKTNLSARQSKKYFDFAANYEINELQSAGVDGVRLILFANTMDTKGWCS